MKKALSRILVLPLTLLLISYFAFFLSHAFSWQSSSYIISEEATAEATARYQEGIEEKGYISFLSSFFKGQWGESANGSDIFKEIKERFPVTLALTFFSLFLSLLISLPLSLFFNGRAGKIIDLAAVIIGAFPSFLLSLALVLIFSVELRIFPVAGYKGVSEGLLSHLFSIFLPSLTLALLHSSLYIRVFKRAIRENSEKEYSLFARVLGERNTVVFSAFRPSLPVLFSLISENFASAISGSVIVETVFALPGLGSLMVRATLSRDVYLSITLITIIAILVTLTSILLDLLLLFFERRRWE